MLLLWILKKKLKNKNKCFITAALCKKKKKKVGRRAGQITEFQTADNQSLPHGEQNTYADVYSMKKK